MSHKVCGHCPACQSLGNGERPSDLPDPRQDSGIPSQNPQGRSKARYLLQVEAESPSGRSVYLGIHRHVSSPPLPNPPCKFALQRALQESAFRC